PSARRVLRVQVEERVDAREQLLLDLCPRALDHVQRHASLLAAREADPSGREQAHLTGREEPHAVDEGVTGGAAPDELQLRHGGGSYQPLLVHCTHVRRECIRSERGFPRVRKLLPTPPWPIGFSAQRIS